MIEKFLRKLVKRLLNTLYLEQLEKRVLLVTDTAVSGLMMVK